MTTEIKTISPSILGRNRKRYATMLTLDGMTEAKITETMTLDIALFNKQNDTSFTFEDYTAMIETLNKASVIGKRESDKRMRDTLIEDTQSLCGIVNLATSVKRELVTLSDADKVKAFDALGVAGDTITSNLKSSFAPIGGMSMLWCPSCQDANIMDGLAVYIGGWEDGSKNPRYQYAPRKCPVSKRSGYRDDSFDVMVHDVNLEAEIVQPDAETIPETVNGKPPETETETIPDAPVTQAETIAPAETVTSKRKGKATNKRKGKH